MRNLEEEKLLKSFFNDLKQAKDKISLFPLSSILSEGKVVFYKFSLWF